MKKQVVFSKAEFGRRIGLVKSAMEKLGIEILVVAEPANHNYLTGYDAYSFYTPQLVIVSLDRDEPIWVGRALDVVSAEMTTYLSDESIVAYQDDYLAAAGQSPYAFVADVVKKIGGERSSIGVEMRSFYYPASAHAEMTKALPNASFLDADVLINWIRMIKSPEEIEIMRQGGKISDATIARALDVIEPGMRECDLAAAIYHQQISGTAEFGGTYACVPPMICVGERAKASHASWTDDPIPASTILTIEVYGTRLRYQVNLARTIAMGEPDRRYQELANVIVEALNAGLDQIKPGRTCAEVDSGFRQVFAKHGYQKETRNGYPLGSGYPPTMMFRTCSIHKDDHSVLEAGMSFHMHNGLWLDDVGVSITQPIVVTETGFEPLTMTPRTLFVR